MEETVKKPLWCPSCQFGPGSKGDNLIAGDNCPTCVEKARHGHIKLEEVSKLWDCEEHKAHIRKLGELKRMERDKKAIKAHKTMDDVKKEVRDEFQGKLDAQAQELSDLRRLISSQQPVLKPIVVEPTPIQVVKPKVKATPKPDIIKAQVKSETKTSWKQVTPK